jgi:hypothetical protein
MTSHRRTRHILSSAAYAASGKARLVIVPPPKTPFDIFLTDSIPPSLVASQPQSDRLGRKSGRNR